MDPNRLFPIIALVSLVTVEAGGWALLGSLTGGEELSPFEEQFFRAGHAHAGTLLVLSLVYHVYLGRTALGLRAQWAAGALLLFGILAQAGGFFLHYAIGDEGENSAGSWLTRGGGVLLAGALILLAAGLARGRTADRERTVAG